MNVRLGECCFYLYSTKMTITKVNSRLTWMYSGCPRRFDGSSSFEINHVRPWSSSRRAYMVIWRTPNTYSLKSPVIVTMVFVGNVLQLLSFCLASSTSLSPCGRSDHIIRLFSRDPARQASPAALSAYKDELAAAKISATNTAGNGDLDLAKLPGRDALSIPGEIGRHHATQILGFGRMHSSLSAFVDCHFLFSCTHVIFWIHHQCKLLLRHYYYSHGFVLQNFYVYLVVIDRISL